MQCTGGDPDSACKKSPNPTTATSLLCRDIYYAKLGVRGKNAEGERKKEENYIKKGEKA